MYLNLRVSYLFPYLPDSCETDWSASLLEGEVRTFVQVMLSAADLPVEEHGASRVRMTAVTQIWVRGKGRCAQMVSVSPLLRCSA